MGEPLTDKDKGEETLVEFHKSCGHYGDDYQETAPEGAEIIQGDEYCTGCWAQIVDTGYPHSGEHHARRFNYEIRI